MGDAADDLDRQMEFYVPNKTKEPPCWETKDGNYILIKEMGTSHIRNSIELLRRKDMESHVSYLHLVAELFMRTINPPKEEEGKDETGA